LTPSLGLTRKIQGRAHVLSKLGASCAHSFRKAREGARAPEYLGHKDGARFILANEWLLASGYGSPQVYSSFEWQTRDDSPPARSNGLITDADCSSDAWTCDHRNRGIVKWHNFVGNAKRANF